MKTKEIDQELYANLMERKLYNTRGSRYGGDYSNLDCMLAPLEIQQIDRELETLKQRIVYLEVIRFRMLERMKTYKEKAKNELPS